MAFRMTEGRNQYVIWGAGLAALAVVCLGIAAAWMWGGTIAAGIVSLVACVVAVPGINAMTRPGFRVITKAGRAWSSTSTAVLVVASFSLWASCAAVDVDSGADSTGTVSAETGADAFPLIFPTCEQRLGDEWADVVRSIVDPQIQVALGGGRGLGVAALVAVHVPRKWHEPGRADVCFFWVSRDDIWEGFGGFRSAPE